MKYKILPYENAVGWDSQIAFFFQNPFFLQSQTKVKSTGRLTRPLKIFRWNNRKWVIERPYWSKVKWSFDFYLFLELCKMEKFSIQIIPDPSHKRGMIIRISGTKSKIRMFILSGKLVFTLYKKSVWAHKYAIIGLSRVMIGPLTSGSMKRPITAIEIRV